MYDAKVFAACARDRKCYDRVADHVDASEFSPMGSFWWPILVDWYQLDPKCSRVDIDLLRDRGSAKANEKHRESLLGWFNDLDFDISSTNVVADLLAVKRHARFNELAMESGSGPEKLLPLVEEYLELLKAEDFSGSTWTEAADWDEMFKELDDGNKIKLLPLQLNKRVGNGAVRGNHIGIFGPTEIGKSLFVVNMTAGFLRQGLKVVYVSNEEPAIKTKLRVLANLAHMTHAECQTAPEQALEKARKKGIDNLFIGDMDPGDVNQLEEVVKANEADVVIVDQLRNLNSLGKTNGSTQRMEAVSREFRSMIIRQHVLGVSVVQANAGEHGKPQVWMSYDDVDSSRTGYPAQCDLLVAIGANEEMENGGYRAVSLCKNKLSDERHDGFLVEYDLKRSKCK